MQQTCPISHKIFSVSPKEKQFYTSLDLPTPTIHPIERWRNRMIWRNDRTFCKRKCDGTGEMFVSSYPEDCPSPVYKPSHWWSDAWDPLDHGQEFDFDRPFFEQWYELFCKVPRLGIDIVNCENSDFCNYCGDDKNCYLDIAGEGNEDCYYNLFTKYSRDCVDCTFVYHSELCYELINAHNCYETLFSMNMENCSDCAFCFDMKGCKNCLFSSNLRQKEFHIFNQPYSKEEYETYKKSLQLDSSEHLQGCYDKWLEVMKGAYHRDMVILNSENCTGNNIQNSKNIQFGFNVTDCEDGAYLYDVLEAKNCYDVNYSLYKPEHSCELISTLSMSYSAFCMATHFSANCLYCDQCNHSSDLFGCIGVKQKKYCILNKQYTETEYKALKKKIVDHMKQTGELGQFFPAKYAPFAYNETIAQEYLPLTKEQAETAGFKWNERKKNEQFRLIDQEINFYKKLGIAPPTISPDRRHLRRMNIRPPRWLYNRTCSISGKKILSPYTQTRPEKVLSEEEYFKILS